MFLVLGAGWALGAVLGLAWRWRRGWAWLAAGGLTLLLWGQESPLPVVLAGAGATLLLGRWALRAFSGGAGAGGVRVRNAERGTPGARSARLEAVAWGAEPPPRVWPVKRLVPQGPRPRWRLRWHPIPLERELRGYVTTVIGSGGTGKSYLLVDLAIALLTGTPWLGHPVLRLGSVLYCDAELDVDTMRERAWQVARGRGLSRPPGPSRWWQLPLAWLRPRGLYYLALPVSLATEEGLALVATKAKACKAELILFDSLTIGSAGAGLSDQNAWNWILAGMEAWGVPCVVIDHMGKSEGRGAVGSFMKQAKVRSALELERKADGTITVEHSKSNFGPMVPEWSIRPGFEHCDGDDPAAGLVRFDVVGTGGLPVVADPDGAQATPSREAPAWGKREELVLAAFRARGSAGATAKSVGEELRGRLGTRAERHAYDAVRKLEQGGALLAAGKVPTPGGGPPATRYVAAGELPVGDVAVAQAEALLRQALPREGRRSP